MAKPFKPRRHRRPTIFRQRDRKKEIEESLTQIDQTSLWQECLAESGYYQLMDSIVGEIHAAIQAYAYARYGRLSELVVYEKGGPGEYEISIIPGENRDPYKWIASGFSKAPGERVYIPIEKAYAARPGEVERALEKGYDKIVRQTYGYSVPPNPFLEEIGKQLWSIYRTQLRSLYETAKDSFKTKLMQLMQEKA